MVRQAYVNRLVLGRSAFDPPGQHIGHGANSTPGQETEVNQSEPTDPLLSHQNAQRYNARGYPDNRISRQLARRNRHAQNDVLTTIGVCVSIDEQEKMKPNGDTRISRTPAEKDQARVIIEEHWYGSLIGSIVEMSAEAASLWIVFLRRRIQVFNAYTDVPFSIIIPSEWAHSNHLAFLAAGLLPDMCYHGLKGFAEGVWETIEDYFGTRAMEFVCAYFPSPKTLIFTARFIYQLRTTRVVLEAYLDIFMMLQELRLIDSWPPFPLRSLAIVYSLGPPRPRTWTISSAVTFARASAASPYVLCFVYNLLEETLREKLFAYMQTILRRPDNPDNSSFRLELEDERVHPSEAPVLRLPVFQRSFTDQLAVDWRSLRRSVVGTVYRFRNIFGNWPAPRVLPKRRHRTQSGSRTADAALAVQTVQFASQDQAVSRPNSPAPEQHSVTINNNLFQGNDHSPPRSPGGSISDVVSEVDPSAVQVRTRSGSTSTLHMDLELQLPTSAQQNREQRRNSFSHDDPASGSVDKQQSEPSSDHYRVTQLTVHSSTTLSIQLALVLSSALLVPLESLYLRSITRSFLAYRGANSAQIDKLVYRPMRLELRRVVWSGLFAYSGQILLCFGIEAGLRLYFWRVCGLVSLWWGRNKFQWGRL